MKSAKKDVRGVWFMKQQLDSLINLFDTIFIKSCHLSIYLFSIGLLNFIIVCIFDEEIAMYILYYLLVLAVGLPTIELLMIFCLKSLRLVLYGES